MRLVALEVEKPDISAEARRWCPAAAPLEEGGRSEEVVFDSGVLFLFAWFADMMKVVLGSLECNVSVCGLFRLRS